MAEYISKEAVKNEFGELFTHCAKKELQIAFVFDRLMSLPAADVVGGEMYRTVLNKMIEYANKLIEIREVLGK